MVMSEDVSSMLPDVTYEFSQCEKMVCFHRVWIGGVSASKPFSHAVLWIFGSLRK